MARRVAGSRTRRDGQGAQGGRYAAVGHGAGDGVRYESGAGARAGARGWRSAAHRVLLGEPSAREDGIQVPAHARVPPILQVHRAVLAGVRAVQLREGYLRRQRHVQPARVGQLNQRLGVGARLRREERVGEDALARARVAPLLARAQ